MMLFVVGSPIVFVSGVYIAEWHIKRLAHNGGESNYPRVVQDTVESYRRQNKYIIQEYPWDDD